MFFAGRTYRKQEPFRRSGFPPAGFAPEHECQSTCDDETEVVRPHRDHCPSDHDLPLHEDTKHMQGGDEDERDNAMAVNSFMDVFLSVRRTPRNEK